jgi:hypothetical protein
MAAVRTCEVRSNIYTFQCTHPEVMYDEGFWEGSKLIKKIHFFRKMENKTWWLP